MSHESSAFETPEQLRAECERLRQRVGQLETQHRLDEERLQLLRLERDGYLDLLQTLANAPIPNLDWEKLLRDSDCKTLDQFLPALEEIVR